jgi:tetratricopeptide (TPR) repeat protein
VTEFWNGDPAYQEYKSARWRRDAARAAQLVAAGLESPDSHVRAHWLVAKASLLMDSFDLPGNIGWAWRYLEEALELAPEHAGLQLGAFRVALAIISYEGPAHPGALRRFGRALPRLVRDPGIQYNIGTLRFAVGKWRQALLWIDQALAGGYISSGGAGGQAVPLAARARTLARLGRLTEADAALAEACQRFEQYGQGRPRPAPLSMAQAEVLLAAGRLQAARTVLQTDLVGSPGMRLPGLSVQVNMVAAELALAEANPEGYRYYSERALETCGAENLTLTIHYVRAVMALAERKYACYHQKKATRQV